MLTKHDVRQRILDIRIIPVIRADSAGQAIEKALAICGGGIPIVELTMTVPDAVDVISELSRTMPEVVIGAGTVLDAATAKRCLEAGAQFLVSPGFDMKTVAFAKERGVLMIPGALTPTEVMHAWKHGCDFVKIFPCGSVGGPDYLKTMKTVLPHVEMIPTGGVSLSNAGAFLCAGAAAIGVGSELTSATNVTEIARQFIEIAQGAKRG
jgi:2-dehydro-3-deoxyphosphogluconate aldolase / (4S)-4-hydroxy-2-oxoglutarate aldolase